MQQRVMRVVVAPRGPTSGVVGANAMMRRRGLPFAFNDARRRGAKPYITISGVTKDSGGSALGGCVVQLFRTDNDQFIAEVTSEATTGAYSFSVANDATYYLVAYKAGSPDVSGTTVNTIVGT